MDEESKTPSHSQEPNMIGNESDEEDGAASDSSGEFITNAGKICSKSFIDKFVLLVPPKMLEEHFKSKFDMYKYYTEHK